MLIYLNAIAEKKTGFKTPLKHKTKKTQLMKSFKH